MGFALSLGLAISSMFFFALFIFFGIKGYVKRSVGVKYDLRNTFPYEINYQLHFLDNILPNIFLILFLSTSICFFAFFDIRNLNGFTIFMMITGIMLSLCNFFIYFADLKYIRFHLLLVTLLSVSSFGLSASIALFGFNNFKNDTTQILDIVIAIIAALLGLFVFAVMMNPKMNFKLEMKKVITEDGRELLVRPKYFVMAFSEWLFIFSLFINQILILILYLPI